MKKRRFSLESIADGFNTGSRNWLLHARYVRGEHSLCLELADDLQKQYDNKHRYAHYIKKPRRFLFDWDNLTVWGLGVDVLRRLSIRWDISVPRKLGSLVPAKNFRRRYKKSVGSVLADAGRLQEALERYHSCIRLQPQDPEPLKQVASCLSRQHRFQLSLEAYLEADKLSKHPDPDIYCALAECSWNLGDLENGVEWARSAVQAGGGERAGALLAKLLLACDDVNGALVAYDQALATHACGADTLAAAGALRLRAGDPRRAFQLLGAALAQQPTQHAAALALAAMMLQHKDLDAALSRLKTALTAHPTCVAAHANLGMALLAKKKYIAALTCLQRAAWAAPLSARAAHNLGVALLVCKRPASAFCRLATAAALQPFQPYTVLLIGIALERLGDSRADVAYSRALALAGDDPLIRINVAGRHARAGRLHEAAEEAVLTAELLSKEEIADAQLTSAMTSLLELVSEAGMNRPPVLITEAEEEKPAVEVAEEELMDEQLAPDEV